MAKNRGVTGLKGKEWRRNAMAAGEAKRRREGPIERQKPDPSLSNHKRHQMRKARRAYLQEKQLESA